MKVLVIPNEVINCKIYAVSHAMIDYSIKNIPDELSDNFHALFEYNDFFGEYSKRSSVLTIPSRYEVFLSTRDMFIGLEGTDEELLYFNLRYFHDKNEIIEVD